MLRVSPRRPVGAPGGRALDVFDVFVKKVLTGKALGRVSCAALHWAALDVFVKKVLTGKALGRVSCAALHWAALDRSP
jgi:hypothetical protein